MAANLISQLTTANTFQHWLGATQSLIGTANLLTDGNGQTFFANTVLRIGGSAANVSLNVETGATINVITGNTVNTINIDAREVLVTGNITSKTSISMNTGTGTFQTDELIYQGADLGNATATAVVHTWDGSNKILTKAELEQGVMDTLRGVVAKEFPDLQGADYEWKVSQIIAAMSGAVLVNSETGEVEYDPYDPKYWEKKS